MKILLTNKNTLPPYSIFLNTEIDTLKKKLRKELSGCKGSIEEAIILDDEE
jgi:hypothetical protein